MKNYRMKLMTGTLAVLFCLSIAAAAQRPKAHRHKGQAESMLKEISPDFSMTETALEKNASRENVVVNRKRTFEAFTVDGTRIFVKNRRTGKVFEIHGLPFEWREFSDLAWADDQTLMFDRWPQPHYGNHYAVNVVTGKLVEAAPFPDEFMLKQQSRRKNS